MTNEAKEIRENFLSTFLEKMTCIFCVAFASTANVIAIKKSCLRRQTKIENFVCVRLGRNFVAKRRNNFRIH